MPSLSESFRCERFADIAGHKKEIAAIRRIMARPDWDRDAFWLDGISGVGKSTAALCFVGELDIDQNNVFFTDGPNCDKATVAKMCDIFALSAWGNKSAWKLWIVDEADNMTAGAVAAFKAALEENSPDTLMRKNRLVVFTSNKEVKDMYGDPAHAFTRRVKSFTLKPDVQAFAERAREIAMNADLDGQPLPAYVKLLTNCGGNLGLAIQKIECGCMMPESTVNA